MNRLVITASLLFLGACGNNETLHSSRLGAGDAGPNPVSWQTPTVSLSADDFWIVANGQPFTAKGATIDVHSDPGFATYTTLELIWMEQNVDMRLFMYFGADPQHWWVSEMRTYNGQPPAQEDWLYYEGTFFQSPVGAVYTGDVDLTNEASDPYPGELHLHGMKLSTTLAGQ